MKIVSQEWWFEQPINGRAMLYAIERAARVCYKSEDKIADGSDAKLILSCIKRGHESILEHCSVSIRIVTDRALANEIVRHRIASFSQMSTRYVKYDDIDFIQPSGLNEHGVLFWRSACYYAEVAYRHMIESGCTPQQARSVLPLSTATELVMTTNLRSWRNVFNLRCDKAAHPDIRLLMLDVLRGFHDAIPVVFDDIYDRYFNIKHAT